MIGYGNLSEKDSDDPDPADMIPCGEKPLRRDGSAADGINSSIDLDQRDLTAVGAERGDKVLLYVEANGKWVAAKRGTYESRPGIGLYHKERKKLDLDVHDTIKVWLDEVEEDNKTTSEGKATERANEAEETKQQQITEDVDQDEYVWLTDAQSTTYHQIRPGETVTVCGVNFSDHDHRTLSDPGDALDECGNCAIRPSEQMSNRELVEWLGDEDRADFDVDRDVPSYLNKDDLVALRDYVMELETELSDEAEA